MSASSASPLQRKHVYELLCMAGDNDAMGVDLGFVLYRQPHNMGYLQYWSPCVHYKSADYDKLIVNVSDDVYHGVGSVRGDCNQIR